MGKKSKKRISPPFQPGDWERIHNFAEAQGRSMSDIVREYTLNGMNQDLIENGDWDTINQMINEQLRISIKKEIEYLNELQEKTYMAAAASYYLLQFFLSNIKGADKQLVEKAFQEAENMAKYHLEFDITEGEEDV